MVKQNKQFCYIRATGFFSFNFFTLLLLFFSPFVRSQYLQRTLSTISEVRIDLTTTTSHYTPMFGAGDENSGIIKAAERYGSFAVDSGGKSNIVNYSDEEIILYVMEGTGILHYSKDDIPISENDFIYIPVGTKFGFSNPRERSLSVFLMGFKIFPGTSIKPTAKLMIANTKQVPFQVLSSHGPTTQFQLLMGTTESTRDRLSAAYQVTSLFIMDFAANGTNIPHRHDKEEEIYFILRGHGDIVAGETEDKKELRHPSKEGDAYFYSPKTLIGFYSGNKEGEEHARILAIRFKYPVQLKDSAGK